MALLTEELVLEAIHLALPTIRELVKNHTWGPLGVVVVVDAKGLDEPYVHIMDELGTKESWVDRRGNPAEFVDIALGKARVARRAGKSSLSVVNNAPWSLEEGDFIYQGGAAEDTDFGVGASGAYGETDEACSWIVWNIIRLLCLRKIAGMREQGINRLP